LNPAVEHQSSPFLPPQRPELDQLLMLNPTLSPHGMLSPSIPISDSVLLPTHKEFILVAQIVAEQIIFGSSGMSIY
jgi:hypothetical protein